MNLFLQLLGNGVVQGAVAMLYAAGFGFVYRSFRVFHIAMGAQFVFSCYAFYLCAVSLALPLAGGLLVCALMRTPFGQIGHRSSGWREMWWMFISGSGRLAPVPFMSDGADFH